eukprot:scaffold133698_cov30-Tisochrysis_lutea.AAC.2
MPKGSSASALFVVVGASLAEFRGHIGAGAAVARREHVDDGARAAVEHFPNVSRVGPSRPVPIARCHATAECADAHAEGGVDLGVEISRAALHVDPDAALYHCDYERRDDVRDADGERESQVAGELKRLEALRLVESVALDIITGAGRIEEVEAFEVVLGEARARAMARRREHD